LTKTLAVAQGYNAFGYDSLAIHICNN